MGEWRRSTLPDRLEDWVQAQTTASLPKGPPWPLLLRRDGRQLGIRRLPVPHDDRVALLVTERSVDIQTPALLARLGLTSRQAEVLDLAVQGRTNAEIGRALGIRTGTVETHMTKALARLGVQNRTAAANLIHEAAIDASPQPT